MSQQSKIARRSFFSILGGAAAVGVATKLVPTTPASASTDAAKEPEGNGYRLTEHIKKYYRTTTI